MSTQSTKPLNNRQFLSRWIVGHALSWLVAIAVAVPFFAFGEVLQPMFPAILEWFFPLAVGIGVGGVTARVQSSTIRRRYGLNLKHWVRWSMLAWIVSAALTQATGDMYPETFNYVSAVQGTILFTIPALVQGWMLRRYVPNTWLYVLASIAGAFTFAIPVANTEATFPAVIFGSGIYAAVLGLTLIWIFGIAGIQPREQDDYDTSRLTYRDDDDDDDNWHDQNNRKSYLIQG